MTSAKNILRGLLLPVLLLIVWWFASSGSNSVYFPPLSRSLTAFHQVWFFDHFSSDLVPSLTRFLVGFSLAVLVGIGAGIPLGLSTSARRALWPLLEFFRAMPVAALVPVGLVVLGPGTRMEATLIFVASVWPILISTIDGARAVEPLQIEMARVYGLSKLQRVRQVIVPASMPQIFAGLRIGLAIALAAMVIANMFGSSEGIGYLLVDAQAGFNMPQMWASLLMIGCLGALVNIFFLTIQHYVLAWHRGWRRAARAN